MNKLILYDLFFALLTTISSSFLSGISYQSYNELAIIFLISFVMLSTWTYSMTLIKPRKITVEEDKILHPAENKEKRQK